MVATPEELLGLVEAVNDSASRLRTSLLMGDPILQVSWCCVYLKRAYLQPDE